MNLQFYRSTILYTLRDICPLMYIGQLAELLIAIDPSSPTAGQRRGGDWRRQRKRMRDKARDVCGELVECGLLREYHRKLGYGIRHIISADAILRVPPRSPIANLEAEKARLNSAANAAIGPAESRRAYFVPASFSRAALSNPFFRAVVEFAEDHPTDGRGSLPIAAFRLASLYLSQLVRDSKEAQTFRLTDRPREELDGTDAPALIARVEGEAELQIAHSHVIDHLEDISNRQLRSDRWLEFWV